MPGPIRPAGAQEQHDRDQPGENERQSRDGGLLPERLRGPLPDGTTRMWSPITSTLIMGTREAVLVDPPLTDDQAADVLIRPTRSDRAA